MLNIVLQHTCICFSSVYITNNAKLNWNRRKEFFNIPILLYKCRNANVPQISLFFSLVSIVCVCRAHQVNILLKTSMVIAVVVRNLLSPRSHVLARRFGWLVGLLICNMAHAIVLSVSNQLLRGGGRQQSKREEENHMSWQQWLSLNVLFSRSHVSFVLSLYLYIKYIYRYVYIAWNASSDEIQWSFCLILSGWWEYWVIIFQIFDLISLYRFQIRIT